MIERPARWMTADVIEVNGRTYSVDRLSNAMSIQDREEENVGAARDLLESIRRRVEPHDGSVMMPVLADVARLYGVDRNTVLDKWAKHYGLSIVIEGLAAKEGTHDAVK